MGVGLVELITSILRGVSTADRLLFSNIVYENECVCVSVFQLLSEVEKSFIYRILLIDRPLTESLFAHWTVAARTAQSALSRLKELGILAALPDGSLDLHKGFQRCLIAACTAPKDCGTIPTKKSTHATSSWHSVLERIISGTTTSSSDIDKVTLRLGFGVSPTPPAAYRFVLASTTEQLWTLISEYIALVETLGGMSAAAEALCATLSPNTNSDIGERTRTFLMELDVLNAADGLPGSTMAALRGGSSLALGATLLVDSNMHVTAYTQSGLQVKLVSLFCQIQRVLGRVVVGIITRASVQKAIDAGVSSGAIIGFLSENMLPNCELPPNVCLQIKLWEADCPRNRLQIEPVTVFSWNSDRNQLATTAIANLKQMAEARKGLLFVKVEPDGRIHIGVKSDIAKIIYSQAIANES